MRPPIDGGTALVTGASSGIGRAIARELSPRLGKLVLVARREERLRELTGELQAAHPALEVHPEPCDLTDRRATDAMLARLDDRVGAVDILVNNAGIGHMGLFDASDWNHIERMMGINVDAPVYLTHRLLPGMVERGRGGVLQVSSGFGLEFMPGFAGYVGSKHLLTSFTESIRLEVRDRGIVVTQVCPGPVQTEFVEVMGNPARRDPPAIVRISPERCARAALRGFERDRALVVPGVVMKLVMAIGAVSPRPLKRLVYRPIGPVLRRLERKQRGEATTAQGAASADPARPHAPGE